ncbi:hypothetical protein P0D88_30235 [Paraburkholderia sp. RL18-103-BIB-C]|jgi:hypothetical protein|uniref:hypothetical protein n=1 Tax=unclassified Paraburkholderia TaxID=2615204 RepID=UPI002F67656B
MIHGSRHGTVVPNQARRLLLAATLTCACALQGCATSLETFGFGAGVGLVGAFGLIGCAIGCR